MIRPGFFKGKLEIFNGAFDTRTELGYDAQCTHATYSAFGSFPDKLACTFDYVPVEVVIILC